ncbi:hypothetical protein ACFY15_00615 [Streptomyces sp. NPDC001373]|uniref:hypothetical protein n=1 Tax=Streptomyces sp. NPDC001373 TaxID=3364565 RepID=UPI0036BFF633
MRTHHAITILAAAGILTLTSCSSSTDTSKPKADASPPPAASPAAPSPSPGSARKAAGLPEDPQGPARASYLTALKTIHPSLVTDEKKAVDNGVNQCSSLTGKDPNASAASRFTTSQHEVTQPEAIAINTAVKTFICPK